ncbi:MAG: pilus assembly protein PilM [Candidatus Omnitrophica bacterium]|nr:pilus assembly protein PilM [Candidatus Omnitrophota bacterium]
MKLPLCIELGDRMMTILGIKQPHLYCHTEAVAGLSDEQITDLLKDSIQKLKLRPESTILSLPRNLATVRNLHLPSQNTEEIAKMVDLNVVRIVPYRKEEILSSYQLIGLDDIGYSKVILAIIHKDVTKRMLKIIENTGLLIDRILLSSYGAREWTLYNYKPRIKSDQLNLLLDINYDFTDFIVFDNNNLLFTRSVSLEADKLKEPSQATRFIGEIRQSLVVFQNEESNKKLSNIFLSGAVLPCKNLSRTIEKEMDIPTIDVPQPYGEGKLKLISTASGISEYASLSAQTAFLLKERSKRILFTVPEIQIRQNLKEKTKKLTLLGGLAIYLFTLVCGMFLGRIYNQQTFLDRVKEKNIAIGKEIGELPAKLTKIRIVKNCLKSRMTPLRLLSELQKVMPEEIAVEFVSLSEQKKVTLRGQARELSEVFKFVTTLENTEYFKEVQTRYTRKKKVKDKEVTDFELSLTIIEL